MTETARRYMKEKQKRVIVNLLNEDFARWTAYATLKSLPVASMIRAAVEKEIAEMEDSFDSDVEDILKYQQELKRGEKNMQKVIITERATGEVILTANNVEKFSITKYKGWWLLHIEYFDEAIEQSIRDASQLCESTSENYEDDLEVSVTEE